MKLWPSSKVPFTHNTTQQHKDENATFLGSRPLVFRKGQRYVRPTNKMMPREKNRTSESKGALLHWKSGKTRIWKGKSAVFSSPKLPPSPNNLEFTEPTLNAQRAWKQNEAQTYKTWRKYWPRNVELVSCRTNRIHIGEHSHMRIPEFH